VVKKTKIELCHGDLLTMGGDTQREFLHSIAKSKRVTGQRLSLTFRRYLDGLH
jgi:alkylated DNA repair dioxygenase AlkB